MVMATDMDTQKVTKYRKQPAMRGSAYGVEGPKEREGRCSRLTGHVLIVHEGRIECESCGATWKDEGF